MDFSRTVSPHRKPTPVLTPIDYLLEGEQWEKRPVEMFSDYHDAHESSAIGFKELVPLSRPGPGEQYAFEVDLDSCFGCKACVAACHSLNGLDEHESWRDVGFIHDYDSSQLYHQTVTSACHHCVDPGCLNGCPVEAYEKDPETGIVVHLDDQCIGCSYCILKCPYDVPKFNDRLGIVRKCDLCHGRLKEGEAPACAQACPTKAISVTIVQTAEVSDLASINKFLPGAPRPSYTQPTTRYISKKNIPEQAVAGDSQVAVKQHAHWPLILMLVLTQFSVGLLGATLKLPDFPSKLLHLGAFICALFGIISSILHLGRPFRAWRVFLGIRKSWLSREILVFAVFFKLLALLSFNLIFPDVLGRYLSLGRVIDYATVLLGVIGVFTSVMIYVDTQRSSWSILKTAGRFYGTTILGFLLGMGFLSENHTFTWLFFVGLIVKTWIDYRDLVSCKTGTSGSGRRFDWLKTYTGKLCLFARLALPLIGALIFLIRPDTGVFQFVLMGALLLLGEIAERYQFFVSVNVSKMPGGGVA